MENGRAALPPLLRSSLLAGAFVYDFADHAVTGPFFSLFIVFLFLAQPCSDEDRTVTPITDELVFLFFS